MADLLGLLGTLFQFVAFALISALSGALLFLAIVWLPELFHAIAHKRPINRRHLPVSFRPIKPA